MNIFDLKCYGKTYEDPNYWRDINCKTSQKRKRDWDDCRYLTDRFYDELSKRGYLSRKSHGKGI
ncbi:hypothetical protein PCC7424_1389 [Gloeothece citriformis PCC 7424]|uniref:Uncharacterized protein n=1 Tax=Gloeothece citriformis (strain PCC 7424) TaxID=65393 RepID=B7K873_GLOC7|nr:hypothetical protein [Gloeothece citriformis]ACK69833.1 hypothetical protein PCC7424_1389 [Gloeothece citriformis PCC 7424]